MDIEKKWRETNLKDKKKKKKIWYRIKRSNEKKRVWEELRGKGKEMSKEKKWEIDK